VIVSLKLRQRATQRPLWDCTMKALAGSYVWWPGLDDDIMKGFAEYQSVQILLAKAPLYPWVWPTSPWQRIYVDFLRPFLEKLFFLVINAHSKWPGVSIMLVNTTSQTIIVLRDMWARYLAFLNNTTDIGLWLIICI